MKILKLTAITSVCILTLACSENSNQESTTEVELSENTSTDTDTITHELTHEEECIAAIDITVNNSTEYYEGFIDNYPIELQFTPNSSILTGSYVYTENNTIFSLTGEFVSGDIWLARYKDNAIRETFDLYGTVDGLEGKWTKEDQVKNVKLTSSDWSDEELETFASIIEKEIQNLKLTWYEVEDFKHLVLDNGRLEIYTRDGGTSGSTENWEIFHLLNIDEQGNFIFAQISNETTSSWASTEEDIEAGIEDESHHEASVNLIKADHNETQLLDTKFYSGKGDFSMTPLRTQFIIRTDDVTDWFSWDATTKSVVVN